MWMATVRTIFKSDTDPSPVGAYVIQQSFIFSNTGQTAAYGPVGANSQFYAYQVGGGAVIPGTYAFGQNATFLTHLATDINGTHYGLTGQWDLGNRGFAGFSFLNASNVLCFGYVELQTNAWTGAGTIGVQILQPRLREFWRSNQRWGCPRTEYTGRTRLWRSRIGRSSLSPAQERLIFSTS